MKKEKEKVEAIIKARVSSNITKVKAFSGMNNYNVKCIPNLSTLLNPMFKLLKKMHSLSFLSISTKQCAQFVLRT